MAQCLCVPPVPVPVISGVPRTMPSNGEDNEYERLRAAKIAENRAKLAQLGLVEASRALMTTVNGPGITMEHGSEVQPRKKRRTIKEVRPSGQLPLLGTLFSAKHADA